MDYGRMTLDQLHGHIAVLQDELFYRTPIDPLEEKWLNEEIEDILDEIARRAGSN